MPRVVFGLFREIWSCLKRNDKRGTTFKRRENSTFEDEMRPSLKEDAMKLLMGL